MRGNLEARGTARQAEARRRRPASRGRRTVRRRPSESASHNAPTGCGSARRGPVPWDGSPPPPWHRRTAMRSSGWPPSWCRRYRRCPRRTRSEEHTSELQSQSNLVCRLLLEKKKTKCDDTKAIQYIKSVMRRTSGGLEASYYDMFAGSFHYLLANSALG